MIEVNNKGEVVVTIKGDIETYHDTFRSLVRAIMLVDADTVHSVEFYSDISGLLENMMPSLEQLEKGLKPK